LRGKIEGDIVAHRNRREKASIMRKIEDVIIDIGKLVREAHAIGVNEGAEAFQSKIRSIFEAAPFWNNTSDDILPNGVTGGNYMTPPEQPEGRATPGTVKPTVLRIIEESSGGMTAAEIVQKTGFKPNSVRGTLHSLNKDEAIISVAGRWMAAQRILADGYEN
jgi:predicted Rossmann fold nucleotide-binding protein DprA/Smf involved in DNA uptake